MNREKGNPGVERGQKNMIKIPYMKIDEKNMKNRSKDTLMVLTKIWGQSSSLWILETPDWLLSKYNVSKKLTITVRLGHRVYGGDSKANI